VAGFLQQVGKAVKFIASATVGLPLALAASVVVGTAALTLRAMDLCWSEIYKKAFSTDIVHNNFLKGAADGAFDMFSKIWTGFGVSAYIDTASFINDRMGRVAKTLGLENHDQFHGESYKDHLSLSGVEEAAIKDSENLEKKASEKRAAKQAIKDEKFAKEFERKYSVAGPKGPTVGHAGFALSSKARCK